MIIDKIPKFDSCYFVSLETGAKIIASVHAVCCGVIFLYVFVKEMVFDMDNRNVNAFHLAIAFIDNYMKLSGILIVAAFGLYLFIGVRKKNQEFIVAWIISNLSLITILTFFFFFNLFPDFKQSGLLAFAGLLEALALWSFETASFLVIMNYYRTISKGNLIEEEDAMEN